MTQSQNVPEYVPVYTTFGQLSGEMIRLLLESVDIPAILSQESAGAVYGLTYGPLGKVTILVPASRVKDAETILQAMEDGRLEGPVVPEKSPAEQKYRTNKLPPEERYKDL